MPASTHKSTGDFLSGKSETTLALFHHFIGAFEKTGTLSLHPTKSMIAVHNGQKNIAWITQLGKNFVHVVFPFRMAYSNNLCFQKIAEVPGSVKQFNHHFRMLQKEDVNAEVKKFMKLALSGEK